jgi:hypothetical protein
MLELLEGWQAAGSSRLDREPDGVIDAGAAPAIWDELYPRLVDAVMGGVLGPQLAEFKTLVGQDNSRGPASRTARSTTSTRTCARSRAPGSASR